MTPDAPYRPDPPPGRSGLLRYVLAWTAGAAVAAVAAVALLGTGEPAEETVTLPPVRQIELTAAARTAGCELRTGDDWAVLGLPVGVRPRRPAARAGVFEEPPAPEQLVGALRGGLIVIQHRADLPDEAVEELRALQGAIPAGTIVTPEAVTTSYEVAAVAWRRVLGCRRFTERASEAVRLFRGRFIGSGPDSPE